MFEINGALLGLRMFLFYGNFVKRDLLSLGVEAQCWVREIILYSQNNSDWHQSILLSWFYYNTPALTLLVCMNIQALPLPQCTSFRLRIPHSWIPKGVFLFVCLGVFFFFLVGEGDDGYGIEQRKYIAGFENISVALALDNFYPWDDKEMTATFGVVLRRWYSSASFS